MLRIELTTNPIRILPTVDLNTKKGGKKDLKKQFKELVSNLIKYNTKA